MQNGNLQSGQIQLLAFCVTQPGLLNNGNAHFVIGLKDAQCIGVFCLAEAGLCLHCKGAGSGL